MISLKLERELEKCLDFMYGYMLLKAYFFILRTGVLQSEYPNTSYAEMWRKCRINKNVLKHALELLSLNADTSCLDLCDAFDKASYFALVHPNHPNITLGFIKDADLWNIWLAESPFKISREAIVEIAGIGSDKLKIIDFGCGSVSPVYYGSIIGSRGVYTGVDYSHSMVSIARHRVKAERLDWVNVKKDNVESKILSTRKYDVVICSSILQYVDSVLAVLKNAGETLDYDGALIVFSEVFRDLEPEKDRIMTLYYSLIPGFKRFPSISEILECLNAIGANYRYKNIGRNLLVVEFNGRGIS